MKRRKFIETAGKSCFAILTLHNQKLFSVERYFETKKFKDIKEIKVSIQQITQGPKHHFFGYIGQSLTTPWDYTGTRILTLRSAFRDHLPGKNEPADVALVHLDQKEGDFFKVEKLDESLGWNIQQGTMFYWNPDKPSSQFFFNDRDKRTGRVFTVLYDTKKNKRIHEYRFEDTPVGNGGVNPNGESFLAINYARMARLRPVTGYRDATDWTEGVSAPNDDGIYKINIKHGYKQLLVSLAQLDFELNRAGFITNGRPLFINHTLWSRNGYCVYFFVRAGWGANDDSEKRIDVACTINADGTDLYVGHTHIGGHPEWNIGSRIIGRMNEEQVIYDVLKRRIVGSIASSEIIPKPGGDISLSSNGQWLVNGFGMQNKNYYTIVNLASEQWVRTRGFEQGELGGDLRIDPAPRWNRHNNQILVDGIVEDGTRQMFTISIH